MENIINNSDFDKFKEEVNTFNKLNEPFTASRNFKLNLSDYLKWCEIRRIDSLIENLKTKP